MPHIANIKKKLPQKIKTLQVAKKDFPELKQAAKFLEKQGHNLFHLEKHVDEDSKYFTFKYKPEADIKKEKIA